MKTFGPSRSRKSRPPARPWLALLLGSCLAFSAVAQDQPIEDAPSPPAIALENSSAASKPPSPPPAPVNRREIIKIGGSSHLLAHETAGEMITIMGNAVVDGRLYGESVTIMGSVTVNGRVDGELVCIGGRVTLGPEAEIMGELVAIGGKLEAAPGAVVHGERVELPFLGDLSLPWLNDWFQEGLLFGRPLPHGQTWAWIAAGVLLLVNLLFYVLFRKFIEASAASLERKPAIALGTGLVFVVLFGPLVILLLVSVVGILVVPFLAAGVFLAWFGGTIAVYRFCGGQLGLDSKPVLALLFGNVLFVLLYAVPVVGFAVFAVAGMLGLGAVLTTMLDNMRREARSAKTKRALAGPSPQPTAQTPGAGAGAHATLAVEFISDEPDAVESGATPAASASASASTTPRDLPPLLPGEMERVGFWPRLGATAIDFLIVAPLSIVFSSILSWLPGDQPTFPFLWLVYHAGFWAWKSTTIGGHVLNLRVLRLDQREMDFGNGLVRALGAILSLLPAGIGFMWASWDEDRQSWHDKIAGTTIVRIPPGRSLF